MVIAHSRMVEPHQSGTDKGLPAKHHGLLHGDAPWRAVICQKDDRVLSRLKSLFLRVFSIEVVGVATDGMTALDQIETHCPSLVVTDIDLEAYDGIKLCQRIVDVAPRCRLAVLTDCFHATRFYHRMMRAGVNALLLRSSPWHYWYSVLHDQHGKEFVDTFLTGLVVQQLILPAGLSMSETQVDVLIRLSLSNREIGEELSLTAKRVRETIDTLKRLLHAESKMTLQEKSKRLGFRALPFSGGYEEERQANHILDQIDQAVLRT